jgi:hypothetical protein
MDSHPSRGVAGFDGRSAPESVYDELARILLEEAERRELAAEHAEAAAG